MVDDFLIIKFEKIKKLVKKKERTPRIGGVSPSDYDETHY